MKGDRLRRALAGSRGPPAPALSASVSRSDRQWARPSGLRGPARLAEPGRWAADPGGGVIEQARVILVVEESRSQRALACSLLSELGYIAQEAATGAEACAQIAEFQPDAILLAWELPDASGPQLVARWQAGDETRWIPVLLLTAHAEPDRIRHALDAGATDFVRKPIEPIELDARLRAALRVHDLNLELVRVASRDPLTGLVNRRALVEQFRRETDRVRRYGHDLSVALIDVDHFKSINDQQGHDVGDEVLVELSRLLESVFRGSDLIARWGGEEFVVLMPHTNADRGRGRAAGTGALARPSS